MLADLQNSANFCASFSEYLFDLAAFEETPVSVSASPGGFAVDVGSNSPELECSEASSTFDE